MKKLLTVLLLTGFGLATVACNTVEGMGQDIQGTGRAVEDTADGARPSGVDRDDTNDYR